jgi:hypothetical protein
MEVAPPEGDYKSGQRSQAHGGGDGYDAGEDGYSGEDDATRKRLIAAKVITGALKKWYAGAIYPRHTTYMVRRQYPTISRRTWSFVRQ